MADLYNNRIRKIDTLNRIIEIDMEVIHPDAMYFTENPSFALLIIRDAATGDAEISRMIDQQNLLNKEWVKKFTRGFIEKCELVEIRSPKPVEFRSDDQYRYWFDEVEKAGATLKITVTDKAWLSHLSEKSIWRSSAYATEGLLACEPIKPQLLTPENDSFSDDYSASGGWIEIEASTIDDYRNDWPKMVPVARYSQKSYRQLKKFSSNELNDQTIQELLYKTVFVLTRNRNKGFGILLPFGDGRFCVMELSKSGYSRIFFELPEAVYISSSEFNLNDETKMERFS